MRRRPFLWLVVIVAASIVGALGAQAVGHDRPANDAEADLRGDAGVPGSERVTAFDRDPQGVGRWGVVVFRSEDRDTCLVAGREHHGRIGAFNGPDGAFKPFPLAEAPGSCGDGQPVTLWRSLPDDPSTERIEPPRTIIYGLAGNAESVRISRPSGQRVVRVHAGAYIAVFPGLRPATEFTVAARLPNGAERKTSFD